MELEQKAQDIFDRIKPFAPETAYERGLISAEEREYFVKLLTERKWAQDKQSNPIVVYIETPFLFTPHRGGTSIDSPLN
jgi:hypothetical protein